MRLPKREEVSTGLEVSGSCGTAVAVLLLAGVAWAVLVAAVLAVAWGLALDPPRRRR